MRHFSRGRSALERRTTAENWSSEAAAKNEQQEQDGRELQRALLCCSDFLRRRQYPQGTRPPSNANFWKESNLETRRKSVQN